MSVWLVRAGKHGEREEFVLNNGISELGWRQLPNLSKIESWKDLKELFMEVFPESSYKSTSNQAGQIWTFLKKMELGDLVVLPSKFKTSIAIGEIIGPYEYRYDLDKVPIHIHRVKWINTNIPRTAFEQDILYSMGAFMTVCQIKRNNAEERIRKILEKFV